MSCTLNVNQIDINQYIGNSLTIINENFLNLKNFLCDDQGNGLSLRMDNLELSASQIDTNLDTIASAINTGAARAWVRFQGTKDTNNEISDLFTDRRIVGNASFNVRSVYRKAVGEYRIYYRTPMTDTGYVVTGSNSEKANNSGDYGWVMTQVLGTDFADIKISNGVDPDYVSVVMF
jgi:hypothetical protein